MNKKNILAFLFTDLHLNVLNKEVCLDFINFLIENIKEKKPNSLFFLGDFYDVRKGAEEPTLNISKQIFKKIQELNIPNVWIPGNHDKYIQTYEYSYLDVYEEYTTRVVKTVDWITNSHIGYYFFPYFEGKMFEEQLNKLIEISSKQSDNKKVLFAHYMYEELPEELTKNFDKIFLGHNHQREDFPKGQYIGSCIQQGFSEDKYKGFSILYDDLSTKQITFEAKEYITQVIDLNVFTEEKAKSFILSFKDKYPNKYLRVEFIGFHKDISYLKDFCKENNISCISKIDNTIGESVQEEKILISELTDNQIKAYYEEFTKSQQIPENVNKLLMSYLWK
ncbi:hypothetical protein SJC03_254 [Bacteroides phage SJC03]|nr:hypothetical protein SJC03_254 [Bacteroides phage SJC03]